MEANVHMAQHELQLINIMLSELARIRQLNAGQQQPTTQPGQPIPTPNGATASAGGVSPQQPGAGPIPTPIVYPTGQIPLPTMPQASNPFIPRMNSPTVTRHGAVPQTSAIPSGSADLPEGVSIPPGWSLMPLQRLDAGAVPANGIPMHGGLTPNNPPEGAQQAGNGAIPPQSSNSTGGTASGINGGTTSEEIHSTDAQQGPRHSTAEPPQVAAPTPVTPVWGGSAQLFGSGGSGGLPFGLEAPGSSRSASQTREGESSSTQETGDQDASASGEASASAAPPAAEGHENASAAAKGKAPAATVEDAED
ncbi:E3 ubiquitin-protein ligase hrd1 [Diaporthe eres]